MKEVVEETARQRRPFKEQYQELLPLFREHLPQTVVDLGFAQVRERVPAQYIKNAFGSCLASRIVYREGIDFFSSIDSNAVGTVVLGYLRKEKQIEQLIAAVRASGQPFADQAASLLAKAGTRAALMDL